MPIDCIEWCVIGLVETPLGHETASTNEINCFTSLEDLFSELIS